MPFANLIFSQPLQDVLFNLKKEFNSPKVLSVVIFHSEDS
ncbi:hypothetical protein LEP1GSC116_2397 [Leptospira interrogans serovar Icterohaemorrhagiae str. Verdun HP]|uniref:Uncharacterized protein n=4 Tax=Leptospira interrogans TaxID=173 RepID=M3HYX5_LEPIR|nr:hypothetical protein LEP1GSC067_3533 [Leptospira interrogans serovar Lora str. TE 1992]EMG08456.1 hypothetical protein LEP1GSC151_3232 [Leptospira interrogans serovar Grippotyphosa str. LT2186]EMN32540.1 hypothetical protein LEP1GSC083_1922 [Leptospira interrogans serovar Pyrogenes str. L0374]EMO02714.1 hypothetical protein LEP1GSC116_2397 [Leptospira interrogans serovar Icterohaemorrhagiae str. Verdun HP]